jgi:hypothetical protein
MVEMEFIINKIDTDVRQRLQEETKSDKIHSGKGITVNRDLKDKEGQAYLKAPKNDSKNKKYITVSGVKDVEEKIAVEVERTENIDEDNSRGRILDAKK